jgi:hypothetical protein
VLHFVVETRKSSGAKQKNTERKRKADPDTNDISDPIEMLPFTAEHSSPLNQ